MFRRHGSCWTGFHPLQKSLPFRNLIFWGSCLCLGECCLPWDHDEQYVALSPGGDTAALAQYLQWYQTVSSSLGDLAFQDLFAHSNYNPISIFVHLEEWGWMEMVHTKDKCVEALVRHVLINQDRSSLLPVYSKLIVWQDSGAATSQSVWPHSWTPHGLDLSSYKASSQLLLLHQVMFPEVIHGINQHQAKHSIILAHTHKNQVYYKDSW